ncbi:MAG: hypothetical protein AAB677_03320 [Patescibacteria group bacterium]
MPNTKRGFGEVGIIIVILIALGLGIYLWSRKSAPPDTKQPARFNLTYPIGGEIFKIGQKVHITWKNNKNYSVISIQIVVKTKSECPAYTNNGSMGSCRGYEIYRGPNNGFFDWTVPPEYPREGGYLIRLRPDSGKEPAYNLNVPDDGTDEYSGFITLTR